MNAIAPSSANDPALSPEPRFVVFFLERGPPEHEVLPELNMRCTPAEIVEIMRSVLLGDRDKNFVGLIDEDGVTLQFAPHRDGLFLFDIPVPETGTSYSARVSLDECCRRVADLDDKVDPARYPDLVLAPWTGEPPPDPP